MPSAPPPPVTVGSRRFVTALAVAVGGVAFVVRIASMLRGGGLAGVDGYDDGVYYAAADLLVHGRLPYADVLLVHPPGIALVLAPFAALGAATTDPTGVAVARGAVIALGALAAALVAVAAARFGRTAGVVAGFGYALFWPAVFPDHSTLLEPIANAAFALALVLRTGSGRRSVLLAGVAAGFEAAVKIWYAVPAIVLLVFQRERRPVFLLGVLLGAGVPCLPFFLAAPGPMIRMLVLDQIGRPRTGAGLVARLAGILGADTAPGPLGGLLTSHRVLAVLLVALVVLAVAAWTLRSARVHVVLLVGGLAVLLASPSYYTHYDALVTPPLLLVVGVGVQRLAALARRPAVRRTIGLALPGLVLAGMIGLSVPGDTAVFGVRVPAAVVAAARRVDGCVISDDPSALAAMDVLSRDLARGCVVQADVTGHALDGAAGRVRASALSDNAPYQREVRAYLGSGAAVLLHQAHTGLDARVRASLTSGPVLATADGWTLHGRPTR